MINRRKALTVAGTVAATVAGGTLAIAANFGLLGFARDESSSLGALEADYPLQLATAIADDTTSPTAEAPADVIVRYEDILVPVDDRDDDSTPTSQDRAESDESDDDGADSDEDVTTTSSTTSTIEVHQEDDEHEDEDHADELDGFEDDD
jgi:hypothetical protein